MSTMPPLAPLPNLDRSTLRERALTALRQAVVSGQYRPGDHLGEVELAARLGISRGTVREALRHLQQEGLLAVGPRGMLRVNQLSTAEVHGLYEVRGALESLAARSIMAGTRAGEAVAELRQLAARLSDPALDRAARVESDLAFHLRLCELSENPMLVESWRHLEGRIRVTIMSHDTETLPSIMSEERHAALAAAIAAGDPDVAAAAFTAHMRTAAEVYGE